VKGRQLLGRIDRSGSSRTTTIYDVRLPASVKQTEAT
jgi:hypothetical protein